MLMLAFIMGISNNGEGLGKVNLTLLHNMIISMLIVLSNDLSHIIGDWKPLGEEIGCGDQISFTKENTFQLIVEGKKLIEETYKEIEGNRYLLSFFNGYTAEAEVINNKKRILLKLRENEREFCQCYKIL